jgi:hypothetical protein
MRPFGNRVSGIALWLKAASEENALVASTTSNEHEKARREDTEEPLSQVRDKRTDLAFNALTLEKSLRLTL